MELLAPAGNFEQAKVSIESGCDALYGGLKTWSARERAKNLSNSEYRELINICNQRGIKFYLTLNTLMSDSEIEEIISFLKNPDNPRPHGILIGDIGLLSVLQTKFPEIPLHASTQFGAYSIKDVLFFQKLGIQRIVLARELTLNEIKKIRNSTDAELEVFVYGNQCVIFSGNCLWGGLSHSGSGHKGRCIGTCNDLFQNETGRIGNFLWANNIGLFHMVHGLRESGVDSIKIEGRVRSNIEVETVVKKFRAAMCGEIIENDYSYDGYLGGELPPKSIFSDFNPENKYHIVNNVEFTEYDYMLDESSGTPRYAYGDQTASNKYAFTLFKNKWIRNENNILIRFRFENTNMNKKVYSIECFRVNGTNLVISFSDLKTKGKTVKMKVVELYRILCDEIVTNIYEFKSKIPANDEVVIDQEALLQACQIINADAALYVNSHFSMDRNIENNQEFDRTLLMVDSSDDIFDYYQKHYKQFIYVIKDFTDLKKCIELEETLSNVEIIYRLPYLDFNDCLDELLPYLQGRAIMITRISQLSYKDVYSFRKIYGDYMLNVWNSISAKWLREQGVSAIIGHPELSIEQIFEIEAKSGLEIITIEASRIPFGYTRACFRGMDLCKQNCQSQVTSLHNTCKSCDIDIICDNVFGFRTIMDKEYYVSSHVSIEGRRIVGLFGLSDKERAELLVHKKCAFEGKERIYTMGYER